MIKHPYIALELTFHLSVYPHHASQLHHACLEAQH